MGGTEVEPLAVFSQAPFRPPGEQPVSQVGAHARRQENRALQRWWCLGWIESQDRPLGAAAEAPAKRAYPEEWSIGQPDFIVPLSRAYTIKATGFMPYQRGFRHSMSGRTLYLADFDAQKRTITNPKPFANEAGKPFWIAYPRWIDGESAVVFHSGETGKNQLYVYRLEDGSTRHVSWGLNWTRIRRWQSGLYAGLLYTKSRRGQSSPACSHDLFGSTGCRRPGKAHPSPGWLESGAQAKRRSHAAWTPSKRLM